MNPLLSLQPLTQISKYGIKYVQGHQFEYKTVTIGNTITSSPKIHHF